MRKLSHLELLVRNFRIWNCWCEKFCIWNCWCENFRIKERWCEIHFQFGAVAFKWLYLLHFNSDLHTVWSIGLLTSWASKWYIVSIQWTLQSPLNLPCSCYPFEFRIACEDFAMPCEIASCWIFLSDFLPCISWLSWKPIAKGCTNLPHSWLASMIKNLPKTPKLAKNLLETFVTVLNVPIELKGINYYSKVSKIVYNNL